METYFTIHAVAINSDGDFLLLRRAPHRTSPGKWNYVTGHIQERESGEAAAVRELKEETNLTGEVIKTGEPYWVDEGKIRWIIAPFLIKITNVLSFQIDPQESDGYEWVKPGSKKVKEFFIPETTLNNLGL